MQIKKKKKKIVRSLKRPYSVEAYNTSYTTTSLF